MYQFTIEEHAVGHYCMGKGFIHKEPLTIQRTIEEHMKTCYFVEIRV